MHYVEVFEDKRNALEQIADWRNRKKTEGKNTDEQELQIIESLQTHCSCLAPWLVVGYAGTQDYLA